MNKGADAFRSIGEVAKLIGVAPHVLRYWETQFTLLRPMKRPDGGAITARMICALQPDCAKSCARMG